MNADAKSNLVLIPGLMCTHDLYAAQIEGLEDIAAIEVADHTGHADLPAMAAQILQQAPDRFALAGLSMGGYVAFEIMRQQPQRVQRLALMDTNARADRPEQVKLRHDAIDLAKTAGARSVQASMMAKLVHEDRLKDLDLVARLLAMADATGAEAFERQQLAIMGRPDNRPFLSKIDCPTAIIVGAEDMLTPVKVAREMADAIAKSRLEIIPDCGHLSAMEQPTAVNAILREWLTV